MTVQGWNACERKNRYDKKGAQSAVNFWWKKEHRKLEIYPCPRCKHWHLTHDRNERLEH